MKKKLISFLTVAMAAFVAQAVTYMRVEQKNGNVVKFDVENVEQVTFEEGDPFENDPLYFESGVLPGKFSVSATEQVQFSQGNLQYQASTGTWRFAEHQYDVIGADNKNVSATYDGWIDLFGWGTSGYDEKYPYLVSTNDKDYILLYNISKTNYDWGYNNAISNGGGKAAQWRTLSLDEWNYIIYRRTNAPELSSLANVNGVNGYLLLPDGCLLPSEISFASQAKDYKTNVYDTNEWKTLESLGALFLPCDGYRMGAEIKYSDTFGNYWSCDSKGGSYAYGFEFGMNEAPHGETGYLTNGCSVRLVAEKSLLGKCYEIKLEASPFQWRNR